MAKLKKNLGLIDVFAISTGAMFSSGLFLLPGLAAAETGLSASLAYLLAGFLMLPALLSQAELATAMPRAGGTYYFLDRAMGPLMGTIGGLGSWIALVFKSGFALIGMGAYLSLFVDIPIEWVGVGLAAFFCVANLVGAKESSGLQRILVGVLLLVVGAFIVLGVGAAVTGGVVVHSDKPFLLDGVDGLLATAGLVFVSYAGLTKVASVAEEVENPDRNIPLGMALSLVAATIAYSAGVALITLLLPDSTLHTDLAPVASAAAVIAPGWSEIAVGAVVIAAVAAFASTANAGILSASRYPLAMARDHLVPARFSRLGKFGTPSWGIFATGVAMGLCVVLFDVSTVAKLASAFQLVLFGMLNLCVIVMRESKLEYYRPGFRSPFYPWVQIAGIVFPLWLIAEMGWLPMLFTAALVGVCSVWYAFYGKPRVSRSGAILHVFERLGRGRWGELDDELRRILHDKGLKQDDPIDELLLGAPVLEFAGRRTFEEVTSEAAKLLARRTDVEPEALAEVFVAENSIGMMPVVGATAFPHHQYQNVEHPELVVVRVPDGVFVESDPARAHVTIDQPIRVFVFLLSPEHDAGRHYRLLAHLAGRFEEFTAAAASSASSTDQLALAFFTDRSLICEESDPHGEDPPVPTLLSA